MGTTQKIHFLPKLPIRSLEGGWGGGGDIGVIFGEINNKIMGRLRIIQERNIPYHF